MDKQTFISKINGIDIVTVNQDGETYVPIKPICQALGIDFSAQYNKLQSDETLSSTIAIIAMVGADNKEREMVCLAVKFIYGWLFTINPGKVAPEAREAVTRYRRECYDVLYDHFAGSLRRRVEENEAEIKALQAVNEAIKGVKAAKAVQKEAEEHLDAIRKARLDTAPTLF